MDSYRILYHPTATQSHTSVCLTSIMILKTSYWDNPTRELFVSEAGTIHIMFHSMIAFDYIDYIDCIDY